MDVQRTKPALALAISAMLLTALSACGDDTEPTSGETRTDPPATSSSPAEPTGEPSTGSTGPTGPTDDATPDDPTDPASTTTGSATPEPGTPDTVAAPVYFTGDTPFGPRLYREFRQVPADDAPREAVALLLAGDALDPDYGTLLRGVTVESVEETADAIVVTLGEDSPLTADKGTSRAEARLAVQSLVYTLQGVVQTRVPVRTVLADGRPADLFGQPTGRGVRAARALDVLSLVSLTAPEEGASASGTLSVEGVASSFEATVPYAVLDARGREVLSDFTTAEQFGDRLYPFRAEVDVSDLAPGTYTFVARTDDPSGGEGPGPYEDTRTFTVG